MDALLGYDQEMSRGASEERHPTRVAPMVPLGPELTLRDSAPYLLLSRRFEGAVALTPSAGARYQSSRYFGGNWGWQAGLTAQRGGTKAYANFARAFNLPGLYASAMSASFGAGDAWKDLRAELLDHYESGFVIPLPGHADLSLAAYYDEVRHALRFIPPPPPPPASPTSVAMSAAGWKRA